MEDLSVEDLNMRFRLQSIVVADQAGKIVKIQDDLALEKARAGAAEKESGRLAGLLRTASDSLTEVRAKHEKTATQLATLQVGYDEKSALAKQDERTKELLDTANALLSEQAAAKAATHRKMVAVQAELTEAKAEITRLRQGQGQSAQVAGEVSRLEGELSEALDKVATLEALSNQLADIAESMKGRVQSAQNHSDKTNKMLAASYEEVQKLRRNLAYVSRVNDLLQRETVFSVKDKLDVFMLSTSAHWLGEPYSNTEYCVYFMLDYNGRGQVFHEHNDELRCHSGDEIPLADSERATLLGEIKKITRLEVIEGITNGHKLASAASVHAHASQPAIDDLQQVADHLRSTPNGDDLVADFAVIQKVLLAHRRDKAAKQKQAKKGR
jgi:uncharacterized coiled-coil DUF342 family protein